MKDFYIFLYILVLVISAIGVTIFLSNENVPWFMIILFVLATWGIINITIEWFIKHTR